MSEAASARRTIAVLAVCGFASTFAMRFVDPMVVVIAQDLGRDPTQVALLASAFALPYALVQPVLGPVGDALGKERIIQICLALLAAALGVAVFSRDFDTLFALRVFSGMAAGGVIPLALALIGDRVPIEERQVAISRFLLFSISGQLLGGSLSGLLTGALGWRGVFGLAAALATAAALAALLGFRNVAAPTGRFSMAIAARRYGRILSIPRGQALFLFVFVEGGIIFGIQPYIAPLLAERGLGGPTEAGLIIAAFGLGGILYTLSVRGLLRVLGVRRMLAVAGALAAGAFLVLASGPSWPVQAAALFGMGIGFYMLHNSFQTQVTELSVEARASAVSLHAFSYFVGQALAAPLFGLGLVGLGAGVTLTLSAAAILLLGLLAAVVIGRPQPRAL